MNIKNPKGFSLIELLTVVAIIAILAAIALPSYQDYTIRTRVSEGLVLAAAARTAMADTYASTSEGGISAYPGVGPTPPPALGQVAYGYSYTKSTQIASIAIAGVADVTNPGTDEGRVTVTYSASGQVGQALGGTIDLTPGSGTIGGSARPSGNLKIDAPIVWGCGTKAPLNSYRYLPANCRFDSN